MRVELILVQFPSADHDAERSGAHAVILDDLQPGRRNAVSLKQMNKKDQQHLIGDAGTDPKEDRFAGLQGIQIVKQLAWPPRIIWSPFSTFICQQIRPPQLARSAPIAERINRWQRSAGIEIV